jgi:hypothetical protein
LSTRRDSCQGRQCEDGEGFGFHIVVCS